MIKIRKTQPADIAILMDIFEQAKHIMRKDGNMLQWRGNYPSREIVKETATCAPTIPEKLSEPSPLSVETTPHIRISMKENGWKIRFLTASSTGWQVQNTAKEWPMPACDGATNKSPTCVQIPTGTIISCNTY